MTNTCIATQKKQQAYARINGNSRQRPPNVPEHRRMQQLTELPRAGKPIGRRIVPACCSMQQLIMACHLLSVSAGLGTTRPEHTYVALATNMTSQSQGFEEGKCDVEIPASSNGHCSLLLTS